MWVAEELSTVFDAAVTSSGPIADTIYDHIADVLTWDAFRPQHLLERQDIEVLGTSDE